MIAYQNSFPYESLEYCIHVKGEIWKSQIIATGIFNSNNTSHLQIEAQVWKRQ